MSLSHNEIKPVTMDENQNIPFAISAAVYILGVGMMLPWNFFVIANSFWQYKLRNTTLGEDWDSPGAPLTPLQVAFMPTFVILSNLAFFVFGFVTSAVTSQIKERERILGSLAFTFLSMVVVTALSMVNTDEWQETFFYVSLSLSLLINIGIAILQSSLYGMIGFFPSRCITLLVSGQSFAGVVSSLSQVLSLAVGNEDPVVSGIIYFCFADVFLLLSTYVYISLRNQDFYKRVTFGRQEERKRTPLNHYLKVLKKCFWMGFSLSFVFLITLCVYPDVMAYVTSSLPPSTWTNVYFEPTITFLLANTMEVVGKELTKIIQWPGHEGWSFHVMVAARVVFIPLILLCHGDNKTFPTLFNRDVYYILIASLFSLTGGYFGALAMVYYPRLVEKEETELAGTVMASLLGVGMIIGSLLSPAFVALWGPMN